MFRPTLRDSFAATPPLAFLTLVLSLGVSMPLHAQNATASDGQLIETLVVTGTRGRERSITDTPVPVDVISAEQIAAAGALGGEFGQVLQTWVPSFTQQRQSNSGFADLVRPAQLRGMSPDQVLVLVNGKRRHTTSVTGIDAKTGRGTAPVDFNSIPGNAIARVEVLRDGGGSQYGSDAIAGVINVILDERPEGIDLSFTYGRHETEFDPTNDDIGDGDTAAVQAAFGMPLFGDGFLRVGAEYKDREQTNRAGFDQVPFFEDPANVPLVGGQRNFRPGDGASQDLNLWFNTGVSLGDDLQAYSFATFNDREVEGTGFFRYPVGATNIIAVYPLGYRPITTGDNQDLAITGGLRGALGEWQWDGSLSYGENTFESGVRRSLNPSLGPSSPREFDSGETQNDLLSLNLDADRELQLGLASDATLVVGAEYRREGFESKAGELASYQAGPLAGAPDFLAIGAQAGGGLLPSEERDLDRDVFAAYAEVSADVLDNLFVDVSARYEDSDDFGSTWAGKLAAHLELLPGYALRGAISNSHRAPSLVQLGFAASSSSFGAGGQLTTVNTLPVDDAVARALGAQDLDAETSTNYSLGFTGRTDVGLSFTVDFFRIDVDDRITLSERIDCDPANVPAAAAALCAARNITAANFFTNAVNTRTEGAEIVLTYGIDAMGGTLDLSAGYTHARTDIRSVNNANVGGVVLLGVEERNTIEDATPTSKAIFTANWADDAWSLLARVTHYGEATRVFNFGGGFEPAQTYGEEWQADVEGSVRLFGVAELFVGASNLFDAYPDQSSADINFFGNLPYDVLSPLGMNGRFIYGGVRASL